jgi:RNA polymerase sigma factor FliA
VLANYGQSKDGNRAWGRTVNQFNSSNCEAGEFGALALGSSITREYRGAQGRVSQIILQPDNLSAQPTSACVKSDSESQIDSATNRTGAHETDYLSLEQDALIVENLPIVRLIARRIHERLPQHVPIEDLFSAGVVGLMDASRKFDLSKQVKFLSYARFRIHGAIMDSLRTLDWSPRELRRKGRAVEQAIQTLTSRLERAPNEMEIAQELKVDLADYYHLLGELKGLEIGSLHQERWEDSAEEELAYLPSAPEDDPLFRCLRGEIRERLTAAIDALPERERLVMTLYYYEERTMKEIGVILDVVASRVSQLHASAVLHLRTKMAGLGICERRTAAPGHMTSLPARLDPRKTAR